MALVFGSKNAVIFWGLNLKPVIFWVDGKYPQLSIPVLIYAELPPPRTSLKPYCLSLTVDRLYTIRFLIDEMVT